MKAFLALFRIDLKLALRNRSVLVFNYFFPLVFFFVFGQMYGAKQGSVVLLVLTMVTTIGILGNGLFGAGMRAVQERENDVLRRYKVTPITPLPLLMASMITGLILYLPGVVLILFLSNRLYGMAIPHNLISFFLFVCLGSLALRSIGLIIASVVNSQQETMLLIQPIYMGMLFLSGATIPLSFFPNWLQIIVQFIPATYLVTGIGGILQRGETVAQNWQPALALIVTACVGMFISYKLFRWEKEEKLKPAAKLWVAAVFIPFFILGGYQAWSREDVVKAKILARDMRRGHTWLIENARIFVGNGKVIENGSVLIRAGKIAEIYEGTAPDAKSLNAEVIEGAGKTVLPGLIDVHVHLGATGGFFADQQKAFDPKTTERELESYLYCGVTAVRSAGDSLDKVLKLRALFGSGEKLGAELFLCGPLFTAEGGHGTEYAKFMPEAMRAGFLAGFVRTPKTADESRAQVDDLANKHVDAIKGILESGAPSAPFVRMDVGILKAVADEAHAKNLPISIHTGDAKDVADAIAVGANSVEHGSYRDEIPDENIAAMKERGIAFDPTLSVAEGFTNFARGDASLLKRSLVQQAADKDLLAGTESQMNSPDGMKIRESISHFPISLDDGVKNLLRAWRAGVMLVTGSDAGNFLVLHGPTVQHEIELWIAAGIPADVALQAATLNAAKLLRADSRLGSIEKGKEATLLMVDGNPLQDVHALSAISTVLMKGERVSRPDLFDQK